LAIDHIDRLTSDELQRLVDMTPELAECRTRHAWNKHISVFFNILLVRVVDQRVLAIEPCDSEAPSPTARRFSTIKAR
jgi:hypothetical protein